MAGGKIARCSLVMYAILCFQLRQRVVADTDANRAHRMRRLQSVRVGRSDREQGRFGFKQLLGGQAQQDSMPRFPVRGSAALERNDEKRRRGICSQVPYGEETQPEAVGGQKLVPRRDGREIVVRPPGLRAYSNSTTEGSPSRWFADLPTMVSRPRASTAASSWRGRISAWPRKSGNQTAHNDVVDAFAEKAAAYRDRYRRADALPSASQSLENTIPKVSSSISTQRSSRPIALPISASNSLCTSGAIRTQSGPNRSFRGASPIICSFPALICAFVMGQFGATMRRSAADDGSSWLPNLPPGC